jgi:hypothetical protein
LALFPGATDILQIAIAEGISQVPTNTQEDDHVFEVPPTEQCWPFSSHDPPYQISSAAFATEPQVWVADRGSEGRKVIDYWEAPIHAAPMNPSSKSATKFRSKKAWSGWFSPAIGKTAVL